MKLRDFQKYLRSLAEAFAAGKAPNKDLTEAAAALEPFADRSMAEFAAFLQLAEPIYRETGQLPPAGEKKTKRETKPKKESEPQPPKVTEDDLRAAIQSIRDRLERKEPLERQEGRSELKRFETLGAPIVERIVREYKYTGKKLNRAEALDWINGRLFAATTAENRSGI